MKPARNQPCPCGTGEKYKRCCGRADVSAGTTPGRFDARKAYRAGLQRRPAAPSFLAPRPLYAAIEVVHRYLFDRAEDPGFQGFFDTAARYTQILESLDVPQERKMEFILPRIPFDLVSKPHGHAPAEDFLLRYGADLPAEGSQAVRALLDGKDEFVEVHESEGEVLLERLADTHERPWANPVQVRPGAILLGRLVEFDGGFSLFTPEEIPDVTRFNHLDAARFFTRLEGLVWKRLGWRFQSPGKDLHLASIVMRRVAEDLSAESETVGSARKRRKSKRVSKK